MARLLDDYAVGCVAQPRVPRRRLRRRPRRRPRPTEPASAATGAHQACASRATACVTTWSTATAHRARPCARTRPRRHQARARPAQAPRLGTRRPAPRPITVLTPRFAPARAQGLPRTPSCVRMGMEMHLTAGARRNPTAATNGQRTPAALATTHGHSSEVAQTLRITNMPALNTTQ